MEQQKKKRTAGICLTLAGGICWGLSGCFGQYLFQKKDITADWLVMVRLFAGVDGTCNGEYGIAVFAEE